MLRVNTAKISAEEFAKKYGFDSNKQNLVKIGNVYENPELLEEKE
jgi:hypothetical protein